MPKVSVRADTLDDENRKFAHDRLRQPVFLNSVPKSGTHLLRNILRMFVPLDQQYQAQFIQWPNLQQHLDAFDPRLCYLSWGHLLFSDASAIELARVRRIQLVRDPYAWVLARARFFLSDEFGGNVRHLRERSLTLEDLFNLMIFGIHQKAPPLSEVYMFNAVAWLGTGAYLVRYEDVVSHLEALDTAEAETYFSALFEACGIEAVPDDWRERLLVGSDKRQSGTARENLSSRDIELPAELPEMQKRLVDFTAPGLRSLLGYRNT